jgi:hypothetical protein
MAGKRVGARKRSVLVVRTAQPAPSLVPKPIIQRDGTPRGGDGDAKVKELNGAVERLVKA